MCKVVEEKDTRKKVEFEDKKRVISILSAFRNNMLDLDSNTIVELHEKHQHNKIDSVLNKY